MSVRIGMLFVAWLVVSGPALGQGGIPPDAGTARGGPEPGEPPSSPFLAAPASSVLGKAHDQAALSEEIEILRQILSRTLGRLYPQGGAADPTNPTTAYDQAYLNMLRGYATPKSIASAAGGHAPGVEGVYLLGYGIVYTVTLPTAAQPSGSDASKPPPQRLTDWERIRKQLHGESDSNQPEQASAGAREPNLTELLLRTLYENGPHFTQLGEQEHLTVVVTFRGRLPLAVTFQDGAPTGGGPPNPNPNGMPAAIWGHPNPGVPGGSPSGAMVPGGPSGSHPASSVQDYLLLGDLHVKQGQPDVALTAYLKACHLLKESPQPNEKGAWREALQKLAQVYLMTGKADEARKLLEQLEQDPASAGAKVPQRARSAEGQLAPKLIVSVPKALLDRVEAGKIGFEQFQKEARIEQVNTVTSPTPAGTPGSRR